MQSVKLIYQPYSRLRVSPDFFVIRWAPSGWLVGSDETWIESKCWCGLVLYGDRDFHLVTWC